jgi:16S rRNA (guanine527-N7)-methyltransferase
VDEHLEHAVAFLSVLPEGPAVDLGSGGGLPGLVLAVRRPTSSITLLDASHRRTAFLREAVAALDLGDRVQVVTARAELVGREAAHRGVAAAVVARSFATPPVTAECAAPLLRPGGSLIVSEPPGSTSGRWPAAGLDLLGMGPVRVLPGPPTLVQVLQQRRCPERYPRRVGIPAKRPLW